jgi:hypothetical protein
LWKKVFMIGQNLFLQLLVQKWDTYKNTKKKKNCFQNYCTIYTYWNRCKLCQRSTVLYGGTFWDNCFAAQENFYTEKQVKWNVFCFFQFQFFIYTPLTNSVALVHEQTIPTERPPLVGEVSAN